MKWVPWWWGRSRHHWIYSQTTFCLSVWWTRTFCSGIKAELTVGLPIEGKGKWASFLSCGDLQWLVCTLFWNSHWICLEIERPATAWGHGAALPLTTLLETSGRLNAANPVCHPCTHQTPLDSPDQDAGRAGDGAERFAIQMQYLLLFFWYYWYTSSCLLGALNLPWRHSPFCLQALHLTSKPLWCQTTGFQMSEWWGFRAMSRGGRKPDITQIFFCRVKIWPARLP